LLQWNFFSPSAVPTIGFNCEKIKLTSKGISFLIWGELIELAAMAQKELNVVWSFRRCWRAGENSSAVEELLALH
jgi:hypothetical protein